MNINRRLKDGATVIQLTKAEQRCLLNAAAIVHTAHSITGKPVFRDAQRFITDSIDVLEKDLAKQKE